MRSDQPRRNALVTGGSVFDPMSLEDRDWYHEELARRRGLPAPRRMDRSILALAAALAVIIAAIPLALTPRATYGASWVALAEQVTGNIHCTRTTGFVTHVWLRPCQ